jgi:glyoxylase-like metal-dependent hydrolase (beta-lactamase superfamily II)
MKPQVESFYDAITGTVSYVVFDVPGGHAAVIDPVLDFDAKSGRSSTLQADRIIGFVHAQALQLDWIIETHAHADHLSAAQYLKQQLGGRIAIGEHIHQVQTVFKSLFNLEPAFATDGSQFDQLFADGESFAIGELEARALWVPGHTPADMAYLIGDALFVGDTLFMPDLGTARCDFPGGDAHALYRSIRSLLALPAGSRMFMCHDYPPAGRAAAWQSSVAAQRLHNIHVHDGITEAQFVAMREARDATLEVPELILPAVQVNIRAGAWPPADDNGVTYLRLPLNVL